MDPHGLRHLIGIEFRIGFVSCVGCTGCAAFVQLDDPVFPPPAFRQHTVGGELRAGCQRCTNRTAVSCKSDQSQNPAKPIVVQVEIIKFSGKPFFDNPIAVIQRKSLGNFDDVHGAIQVQSAFAEKIPHISTVFGDRTMSQPLRDTLSADSHIQGEQIAPGLILPKDLNLRLRSILRCGKAQ